jgi:hypothetical protein
VVQPKCWRFDVVVLAIAGVGSTLDFLASIFLDDGQDQHSPTIVDTRQRSKICCTMLAPLNHITRPVLEVPMRRARAKAKAAVLKIFNHCDANTLPLHPPFHLFARRTKQKERMAAMRDSIEAVSAEEKAVASTDVHDKPAEETHHTWRFWLVFLSLCLLAFASALDGSIITTALPTITRTLGPAASAVRESYDDMCMLLVDVSVDQHATRVVLRRQRAGA